MAWRGGLLDARACGRPGVYGPGVWLAPCCYCASDTPERAVAPSQRTGERWRGAAVRRSWRVVGSSSLSLCRKRRAGDRAVAPPRRTGAARARRGGGGCHAGVFLFSFLAPPRGPVGCCPNVYRAKATRSARLALIVSPIILYRAARLVWHGVVWFLLFVPRARRGVA